MTKSAKAILVLLFGLLLTTIPVFGQGVETGTISGTVKDATGAVIPGATVAVKSLATGAERTATTGSIGQYQVSSLTPGQYEVTIRSEKFESYRTTAEVTVGGIVNVDAQMTVGQSSAVIEVVGGAATEVNTQTQEVSQLIDSQQLAALPSLTRNPYDFVSLSGNVSNGDSTTPNGEGSQNQTGRGVGFSINGQRSSGTEILLDGAENEDLFSAGTGTAIPVDSVQEYSVITNNFGTEYGRASGGVVNLTTRGGTNALHGSVWEYNRLSAYTANTFNNVANDIPKGDYTRNQFGAQAGGPIIKNKLFVFGTAEWLRVRSQATQTQEVLDPGFVSLLPANVQGYFSSFASGATASAPPVAGSCTNGFQCTTAGDLATAGVPVPAINGVTAVSASQPVFDTVNFKVNSDAGGDVPQNTLRLVGRMDYNMNDKTQMFFRFARDNENQFPGTASYTAYPAYDVGSGVANDSLLYSISHTFNSNLLNNTKVSYSRINIASTYNKALTFTPNLILTNFAADPVNNASVQFPGLENEADGLGGLPVGGPINTLQLEHDISWTKGKHNMRFGGQFTYIQLNYTYGAYNQAVQFLGGSFAQGIDDLVNAGGVMNGGVFTSPVNQFSARVDPQGAVPCVSDPLTGDLTLTAACTVTPPLSPANAARSYRYKDWAIYAQDSWRFTPRLTLNYGLRYEHYGVQHNNHQNLDSNFYYGSGAGVEEQTRSGNLFVADKSPVGQFWAPTWGTAAPRVGFALDIFGDGKSSLRGGFGISYERNFGNVTYNASFNPPASAVVNETCTTADPVTGYYTACPFVVTNAPLGPLGTAQPAQGLPPAELRVPAPNIQTAQTQFWNLDLQREVARNTIIDVGYSGAHGVHLYDINNVNQLGAGNAYLGDPVANGESRPNQQFAAINVRGSGGTSAYDALNVKFQTQDIHHTGVSLVANYTWSHSLDDISSTFSDSLQGGSGAIGSLGYTDLLNPKLDWGSADYDVRHRVVISPIWDTPWYKSGKGIGEALGGWEVSGIFTARTGTPFSIYDITDEQSYYTWPRMVAASSFSSLHVGGPGNPIGPNNYGVLTVPQPAAVQPFNTDLGISDLGPFPSNMTGRNFLRGPGAWNIDAAVQKNFKITERFGLQFRAEGFNVLNHHDLFVNTGTLYYYSEEAPSGGNPIPNSLATGSNQVVALKGGLNSLALGGNHDERRFGQFSLRLTF
jgi:hypothetical protein